MSDQKTEDDGNAAKPQVIELVAEEIKPEDTKPGLAESRPEAEDIAPDAVESTSDPVEPDRQSDGDIPTPPPPPPLPPPPVQPRKKARGAAGWIIAALILGAIGGGWLYRDVLSSYFPTNEIKALQVRLDTLEANGNSLKDQIAAADQSAKAAAQAAEALKSDVQSMASGLTDISARIDGVDQRIAAAEEAVNTAKADLDALLKSVSAPGSGTGTGGTADPAALVALGQRLDALEKDVASLKTSEGSGDKASVTATLSQALSDLKAKIAAGTGFAPEYDRISRMVPAAAGLDVLAANAADGLPTAEGLAKELRAAIPALPQPEAPAPASDSYWDTLLESLSGIISIREIGEADWPQLAEKAAAFADANDLNQAISVVDAAEGEKPMALSQWRQRAAARLQLEAATNQVSEAVLRQITALGGNP